MSYKLLVLAIGLVQLIRSAECGRNLTELRAANYPPDFLMDLFKNESAVCHNETYVSEETIVRFRDDEDFDGTPELGCYLFCIFREKNFWINSRNELHLTKALEIVPVDFEQQALKMGLKCLKVKGDDNCARALWYHNCWKKSSPAVSMIESVTVIKKS